MKVEQPQHVDAAFFFQAIDYLQQLGCGQAELGCLSSRLFPATRTLRIEFHPHTDHWHVAFVGFGDPHNVIQLTQFFDDDNHALAGFRAGKSHLDELFVLETIQHQQTVARLFQRQRRIQFRF